MFAFLLARASNSGAAVAGAGLYGITDELHQVYVPGRTADVADWLVDMAGALVGVWLYRLTKRAPVRR